MTALLTPYLDSKLNPQETIRPVLNAMRNHSNSPRIQVVGTALLMSMGADEEAIADIGEEGGIQDVLAALRAYPNNPEVRY